MDDLGVAPAGFTLLGVFGFGLTAMWSHESDLRVYPFDVSVGSLLPLSGSVIRPKPYTGFSCRFCLVQSFRRWRWRVGGGLEWLLIGCHFQVVCSNSFALELALRVVNGIGFAGGLSVDWMRFVHYDAMSSYPFDHCNFTSCNFVMVNKIFFAIQKRSCNCTSFVYRRGVPCLVILLL